jgi:uncharacterized membrane protein
LLLLGTSLRGKALRQCGSLLGSFVVASLGTLLGASAAFAFNISSALHTSLPNNDGIKIAAALLAKNIGGGINYMAVCACLGASTESVAAGLCVDNVMALVYFPLVSLLASNFVDLNEEGDDGRGEVAVSTNDTAFETELSPIESLSHAFTLAAVLTALGQFLNSQLPHVQRLLGSVNTSSAKPLNLSLPITTLLAVLFSTYYPPNWFLSPSTTTESQHDKQRSNSIAKAGETLGTALLYLFFATAGAPGWRLKESIQQSFPAIASFLVVLYGVHGGVLWGFKRLVNMCTKDDEGKKVSFWKKMAAPQRLLTASSAAIGGPATAVALAQSHQWQSLMTPSLLVGNVGYAVATFIGLLFYSAFR